MRISITGSRVHRVWKCPPSGILPQVIGDQRKHAPARGRGKEIHRYFETVADMGVDSAIGLASPDLRPLLIALDLDDLPVGLACEVAFAWNWRAMTARLLVDSQGQPIADRHYEQACPPLSEDEIAATLDVVGTTSGIVIRGEDDEPIPAPTRGYVGDYKSGHGKYPAPDQFGQLLLGALCVRAVYGCDDVVLELIHIHDDGTNHKARRTVNDWDLDAFAIELKAAMELVEHWEAEYAAGRSVGAHEGPWCEYCEAYKSCPAKVALVRSIPAELMALGVRPGELEGGTGKLHDIRQKLIEKEIALSPSEAAALDAAIVRLEPGPLQITNGVISVRNAADAWMMLERISDVVNLAKQEVCSIAAFGDIPLPDGRVVGLLRTERRDLNGRIVHQVLEKRYGRETADKAVQLESSFTSIHQACTSNVRPGEKLKTKKGDGVEDQVIAEIERLGGVGINSTESVKPHVPKKKRLPSG